MKNALIVIALSLVIISCTKDKLIESNGNSGTKIFKSEDNLIARYNFNKGVLDSGPNGFHGKNFQGRFTTDKNGDENGCILLNGTTDFFEIAHNDAFDIKENFSMGAWIEPHRLGGYIIQKSSNTINGGPFTLDIFPGKLRSLIHGKFDFDHVELLDSVSIKYIAWQHVVVVKEGNLFSLYKDGELVTQTYNEFELDTSKGNIAIGTYPWGYPSPIVSFSGKIDNVFFYGRALSPTEIKYMFDNYL